CEPRFRHMIDSVTAYNQVGTAAQEGKVFGLPREMYGSAADLIFDQHSELLIEHRSESIAMLTAPGNAARSPAQPQPKLTMLLLSVHRTSRPRWPTTSSSNARVREPFGLVGAAEVV